MTASAIRNRSSPSVSIRFIPATARPVNCAIERAHSIAKATEDPGRYHSVEAAEFVHPLRTHLLAEQYHLSRRGAADQLPQA